MTDALTKFRRQFKDKPIIGDTELTYIYSSHSAAYRAMIDANFLIDRYDLPLVAILNASGNSFYVAYK